MNKEALITMLCAAVQFADKAAGEGLEIDGVCPEYFLFDYSEATGDEDYETLHKRLPTILSQAFS